MADRSQTSAETARRSARHFRPGARLPAARRVRVVATARGSRRRKAVP